MIKTGLLLALACLTPLRAETWEVGIFAGRQTYGSLDDSRPGYSADGAPTGKTVTGVRVGYSVLDLGPALLEVTAGFQPSTSTTTRITTFSSTTGLGVAYRTDSGPLDFKASHTSVGMMFNFKAVVAIGAGVEMRFEKLTLTGSPLGQDANYNRPWLRAGVGMAVPSPALKPFIGLEVALALASENELTQAVKAMAPKAEVGLYAGLRF